MLLESKHSIEPSMIKTVFDELEKENIECELVNLSGKPIHGCIACYKCAENQDKRC